MSAQFFIELIKRVGKKVIKYQAFEHFITFLQRV